MEVVWGTCDLEKYEIELRCMSLSNSGYVLKRTSYRNVLSLSKLRDTCGCVVTTSSASAHWNWAKHD